MVSRRVLRAPARVAARLSLVAALALVGCRNDPSDTILLVRVTVAPALGAPQIHELEVTVPAGDGRSSQKEYRAAGDQPIAFPTSLSAQLPRSLVGPLAVEVRALGPAGVVALGSKDGVP